MRTAVVSLVIGATAMFGAACSNGDDDAADEGTTTTTAVDAPTTTASTAPPPGDQGVAAALVVKQSDFPQGWNHSQPADDVDDPADACLKAGPLTSTTGRAESDEFAKSDLATASSVALVFANEAGARAGYAHIVGAEAKACFDQAFRAELVGEGEGEGEEGVELAGASLTTAAFPAVGDERTAYHFTAQTGGTDQPYRYSGHLVLVRAGRSVIALAFGNLGDPIPVVEQHAVAGNVAKRAPR